MPVQPLHICTGQPADGRNKFFPRTKIINKIWRKLDRGEDLLIVAPRRVGKSSILRHIERNPNDGYFVKYISIMSVDSANTYFKKIFKSLLEDDEIYGFAKGYMTNARKAIENFGKKIRGIGLEGIELDGNEQIDYYVETIELLKSLPSEAKKIIFLVDEFPDAVSNIAKYSEEEAINFLQQNRDLFQEYAELNIQFVLTGSIGLGNVVEKLNRKDIMNDLTQIEIEPLSNDDAKDLIDSLCLGLNKIDITLIFNSASKDYFLQKLTWNTPYYIQMIIDELVDDEVEMVNQEEIDKVLDKIIKARSHADYFENWRDRLKKVFDEEEAKFAIEILSHISIKDSISYDEMKKMNEDIVLKEVLEVLKYDGYISENNKVYQFNSPLLKSWWAYHVAE